jgi:hypothetical protein
VCWIAAIGSDTEPFFSTSGSADMLIRINDESLRDLLIADLVAHYDVVATPVSHDRIELTIIGSYNSEAMRLATLLRIRAWEAAQRSLGNDVYVDIE